MVQLAFIGCAHIHTPGFIKRIKAQAEQFNVKCVWDHDAARAQKRAVELGCPVVNDLNLVWSDPQIQAVIICSETNRHEELILAAAKARKHMFVEKPLGMGAKDAYKMAAAIEKAGVLFQTGYFLRGVPINLYLKELVEKGAFGRITRIRGSNCHHGALGGWFDTEWRWMADPAIAGCGAFGDLGTHSLDIMLWLMGEVAGATSVLDAGTGRYGQCDETGEGLMKFSNGAIGSLAAAWLDIANPVEMMISGTEGLAVVINGQLFLQSKNIEGADGKSAWTKLPASIPAGLDSFLNALAGQKDAVLVKAREAAYRSAVMEAMYEGARKQKWVAPKSSAAKKPSGCCCCGQAGCCESQEAAKV